MHVLRNELVAPGAEFADDCRVGSAFQPGVCFTWSSLARLPMIHPEGPASSKT
jgi:hypothetical protein